MPSTNAIGLFILPAASQSMWLHCQHLCKAKNLPEYANGMHVKKGKERDHIYNAGGKDEWIMIHYQSLCPYVILTIGLLMNSRLFYMIKMSCIKVLYEYSAW